MRNIENTEVQRDTFRAINLELENSSVNQVGEDKMVACQIRSHLPAFIGKYRKVGSMPFNLGPMLLGPDWLFTVGMSLGMYFINSINIYLALGARTWIILTICIFLFVSQQISTWFLALKDPGIATLTPRTQTPKPASSNIRYVLLTKSTPALRHLQHRARGINSALRELRRVHLGHGPPLSVVVEVHHQRQRAGLLRVRRHHGSVRERQRGPVHRCRLLLDRGRDR